MESKAGPFLGDQDIRMTQELVSFSQVFIMFNFLWNFKAFNLALTCKINKHCHKPTKTKSVTALIYFSFCFVLFEYLSIISTLSVDPFTPVFTVWAQLDVACFIISLFTAQHVSNVSTSIFRKLATYCGLFHVLYCSGSMCVGVTVWFGWGGNTNTHRTRAIQHMK